MTPFDPTATGSSQLAADDELTTQPSMTTNDNLYALLAERFLQDPAAHCLRLADDRAVTYGEIDRASARIANLIVALGLKPGDRVAAQVEKTPQALLLYLATLRAGCVFLPLNPAYQRQEIANFLGDAEPELFVCGPQVRALADELAARAAVAHVLELGDDGRGTLIDAAAAQGDAFDTIARRGDELAAILYTSGTTGRSKGAMLSHGNLASNARALHRCWRFEPGDVLLHMLPLFHVHGLFVACHTALLNGSPILFEPRFEAQRAIHLLPRSTLFMGVPTYYQRLLAEPGFDRESCRNMRLFICGSAPLSRGTFEQFRQRSGHLILERYGMTEGGIFSSNPCEGERRGGSVGLPLPGVRLRIVDDGGEALADGALGNIEVKGDNVFVGYWRMPEKTHEEFTADGFFRTGDLGRRDSDGYLSIGGRSKDLIISGGLNVYPKEIEALIDAMPGVVESAVIGLPDADFGEAVTAVVVRLECPAAPDDAQIIAALKAELAGFKIPKTIRFADELPRNAMGKVQKNLLRERYSGRVDSSQ